MAPVTWIDQLSYHPGPQLNLGLAHPNIYSPPLARGPAEVGEGTGPAEYPQDLLRVDAAIGSLREVLVRTQW